MMKCKSLKSYVMSGWWVAVLMMLTLNVQTVIAADSSAAIEAPDQLLKRISNQVINILIKDGDELKKHPDEIYKIVDAYILPHLDDVTMAKLALGKNWRKASKEQKRRFVDEFRNLLVRTYSRSLLEFKDQSIKFFPVKLSDDTKKVSIKAEVIQPGGPPIPLAYRMRIKNNAWKVYDIKVDGISLVTSYRGTFTQEVRKKGIDGLLQYLREKSSKLESKAASAA